LLILIVAVALLGECSNGKVNDSALASKIEEYYSRVGPTGKSVEVIEHLQSFPNSWRSPNDAGMTYIVNARVAFWNNHTEVRKLEIFIANSDSWTHVEAREGN
jgi:hypothetical protein